MQIKFDVPAWTTEITVQAVSDATGLSDEEVRDYLPGFIAAYVVDDLLYELRTSTGMQKHFASYVESVKEAKKASKRKFVAAVSLA